MFLARLLLILRKMFPGFDVESIEPSTEISPDQIQEQKMHNIVKTCIRFSTIIALIFGIGWAVFSKEPVKTPHTVVIVLLIPLLIASYLSFSRNIMLVLLLSYLYVIGTILLVTEGATGQPRLFYIVCVFGVCSYFDVKVGIGVFILCLVTFALFACGGSPFSFSFLCVTKPISFVVGTHVINFGLMTVTVIGLFYLLDVGAKQGVRQEKELADALTQKSDDLERALAREKEINQIQGDLLNAVSYEFFTPMSVIKMSSKMMMKKHERGHLTTEQSQAYHAEIEENVGRLSELINIVMTSRPQTNDELNALTEQIKGEIWTT